MRVSIEVIEEMQKMRRRINMVDLNNITFTKNGEPVDIPQSNKNEHSFTGLNNIDFITSGAYKGKQ